MLLKELTALRGVSGDEGEVRSFIVDQAAPWSDEIKVDNMGSVIAWKHSKTEGAPTVMIDAHMDEVGFLVQYIRDDGMIRYLPVGGVDAAECVSKRERICKNAVTAVNGCKARHLLEAGLDSTHYSSHKLRHTAATLMLQNGVDVKAVQEVLGHEHLNTTEIYTHIDNEALRVAARANPLSRVKPKGKIDE